MGFWSNLFKTKSIIKTEIVGHKEGLSEEEQLDNLVIGDMEGGFDGMVVADVYNQYHCSQTTFKVYYDNGTYKFETVDDDSRRYHYLLQFLT